MVSFESFDALLEFREQLLICKPARHSWAWLVAWRSAESGFVARLVRPHMRRCNCKAHANIAGCDVEHHEVLRQREWTIVMLADLALYLSAGVEVVEEMVHDREARLDQSKHLSGL